MVQFSRSVMSDCDPMNYSTPRPPCPSPTPRVHSNSCPLGRWCHLAISYSAIPFCLLQSFPALGSFQMSQPFVSGGQVTGASASASALILSIQDWFPLELTGFISFQSKGLLQHHSWKASILWCSAFFMVQLSHPYMTSGKSIALTRWTFVSKVTSLFFNMLSRFVIARSEYLSDFGSFLFVS